MKLREHQEQALSAITAAAATGLRRMTVAAACGSGKTLIAQQAAQHLAPQGAVLVLLPTKALLTQTARRWREAGRPGPALGVCSLTQAQSGLVPGEAVMTRTPHKIARTLRTSGPVTVFCTYGSLHRIQRAHEQHHLPAWDLVVADEAHRTCSAFGNGWGTVHDDHAIPAKIRLYMTATPRIWGAAAPADRDDLPMERAPLATMDHTEIFGPTVYTLGMAEAIERGILADYQVLLPVVDTDAPDLHSILSARRRGTTAHHDGVRNGAVQVAVLRAIAEHGLRRVLVFHNRVALADAFARSLPDTARQVPAPLHIADLWARVIHARQSGPERRDLLEDFGAPDRTCKILSNVRVLNEGVDLPDVDGVVFIDPRSSIIDAIQAIGRGLRQPPGAGKKTTLVIPVYLHAGTDPADLLRASAFAGMLTLLQALRAHDETFMDRIALPARAPGSALAAQRSTFFAQPERAAQLAHVLGLKITLPAIGSWDTALVAAARYHATFGDLDVPLGYVTDQDFALGQWLASIRLRHLLGRRLPPERRRILDALGFSWITSRATGSMVCATMLARAQSWAHHHGHLTVPVKDKTGGHRLGAWLARLRRHAAAGRLPAEQQRALQAIDPHWNPPWPQTWQRRYHHAASVLAADAADSSDNAAGTARPVTEEDRRTAVNWTATQQLRFFDLHQGQQELLLALHIPPLPDHAFYRSTHDPEHHTVYDGLGHAAAFLAREGHLQVPPDHREPWWGPAGPHTPETFDLGPWLQRCRACPGLLPVAQQRTLEALLAIAERTRPASTPPPAR